MNLSFKARVNAVEEKLRTIEEVLRKLVEDRESRLRRNSEKVNGGGVSNP